MEVPEDLGLGVGVGGVRGSLRGTDGVTLVRGCTSKENMQGGTCRKIRTNFQLLGVEDPPE